MYLDGKTPNEIARILESDIDTINRDIIYLTNKGEIQYKYRGETQKMEERLKNVRRLLYIYEKTQVEIAKILGCHISTIERDIQKLNKEGLTQEFTPKEIEEKSYMDECKRKIEDGTLEEKELVFMKRISEETKSYSHMTTYVRACILFDDIQSAISGVKVGIESEQFTQIQKEIFEGILNQLETLKRKRLAKEMLNQKENIEDIMQITGLTETEIKDLSQGKEIPNPFKEGR